MKQNTLSILLILLFVLGFYTIYLHNKRQTTQQTPKEDFASTEIISSNMKSNEDYRQCLDQNSQLYYQSHGKYPGCHKTLRDLTNWGMGPQTNLGYGQMKYICPVSCLLKQPSDCLEAKATNQNNVIQDISRDLRDFRADTPAMKLELNKGFEAHDKHLDQLYGKKHVQNVIDYIYTSGRQVSDPDFKEVLEERTSVALGRNDKSNSTPSPTPQMNSGSFPAGTPPAFIGFGANNLNMNTTANNTSNILGF